MFVNKRWQDAEQAQIQEQQRLEELRLAAEERKLSSNEEQAQPDEAGRGSEDRASKLYLESEIIIESGQELCESELIDDSVDDDDLEEIEELSELDEIPEESADDAIGVSDKPAKLAKLPSLIDVMLMMDLSRSVKINFAMLLLQQYGKYKNAPKEKAIIVDCLKKIIADLTK